MKTTSELIALLNAVNGIAIIKDPVIILMDYVNVTLLSLVNSVKIKSVLMTVREMDSVIKPKENVSVTINGMEKTVLKKNVQIIALETGNVLTVFVYVLITSMDLIALKKIALIIVIPMVSAKMENATVMMDSLESIVN